MDFGCYGANLATWLMKGEKPRQVTATTRQLKPDIYPRVDADATIIVDYEEAQVIIQASWNWPFNRKDMALYGEVGYALTIDALAMKTRTKGKDAEQSFDAPALASPFDDPFRYLKAVVRGQIRVEEMALSSLENNLLTMEILEAARESAQTGKTIELEGRK